MPLHIIQLERIDRQQKAILADSMRIGFLIQDEDGFHVDIPGVTARRFPTGNEATLWLLKKIDRFIPEIRRYKLARQKKV